ncbi:MAG: DUF1573 domain-containing protein [Nitrospirae bacterium]|nr:DUF1573 domain-containing protein [Nitrospirota bacterium]
MRAISFILTILIPVAVYAQPSIKFDTESHDFGEVKQGEQLEHTFELLNLGTEDLIIEGLVPS